MARRIKKVKEFLDKNANNIVAGFFSFFLIVFLAKEGLSARYETHVFVLEIMCLFFTFFLFLTTLYKFSATQDKGGLFLWSGFSVLLWMLFFRSYLLSFIGIEEPVVRTVVLAFSNLGEGAVFSIVLLVYMIISAQKEEITLKTSALIYYVFLTIFCAFFIEAITVLGLPKIIGPITDVAEIAREMMFFTMLAQALALAVIVLAAIRFYNRGHNINLVIGLVGLCSLLASFFLARVLRGLSTDLSGAVAFKAGSLVFFLLFYMSDYQKRLVQIENENESIEKKVSEKIRQITRQSEAIREKTIESREATRIKSELLANMSHELRTPMNSIIGFTSRVIKKTHDIIPEQQVKNLRTVERNAYQLLGLINTILDVSKIEAGRMEVFYEKINISELVNDVLEMGKSLLGGKDVLLASDVAEGILITSDRTKIKQMLVNLVGNSIKFTEQGEIRISVEEVETIYDNDTLAPLPGVLIKVTDTGVGIKADDLPYIFDDYKQVDGSLTRKTGGTGLGLALVKRFSQLLGGNVTVESEYERGTTFHIRLPKDSASLGSLEEKGPKPTEASRKAVVVYETDAADSALEKKVFNQKGYEVKIAQTIDEAFICSKENYPRLVVLDILAFEKKGVDLIKKFKNNYYTKDVRFCFCCFYNKQKYGYICDVLEYVYKPVNKELVSRIVNIASRTCPHLDSILVIDHDEGALNSMHELLLQEGDFSVRIARDEKETLSILHKQKPDIIFFNLFLPEGEGYKIIAQIGTSKKWCSIPIIFVVPKMLDATHLKKPAETIAFFPDKGGLKRDEILGKLIAIADNVVL
jgi:signal transduction histidine kinase/DNA-binding response OmpR family regulator